MEQQFDRFKGASWFPQGNERVLVGGCGGIGSWLTFFLARIGYLPAVYDFDEIDSIFPVIIMLTLSLIFEHRRNYYILQLIDTRL